MAKASTEAQRKREARDRNKEYIRQIKEKHPCADCGETYHFSQMDFDHITGKKRHNLARYANSAVSISTIKGVVVDRGVKQARIVSGVSKVDRICRILEVVG